METKINEHQNLIENERQITYKLGEQLKKLQLNDENKVKVVDYKKKNSIETTVQKEDIEIVIERIRAKLIKKLFRNDEIETVLYDLY